MTRFLDFVAAWRYWIGYVSACLIGNFAMIYLSARYGFSLMIGGFDASSLIAGVVTPIIYVMVIWPMLRPLSSFPSQVTRYCPRHWIKINRDAGKAWDKAMAYRDWANKKGHRCSIWNDRNAIWIGFKSEEVLYLAHLSV